MKKTEGVPCTIPKKSVHTNTNVNALSLPGFTTSFHPFTKYFFGLPFIFTTNTDSAVSTVLNTNTRKPQYVSSPSMPATAPANAEERNLMVDTKDALACTLGR